MRQNIRVDIIYYLCDTDFEMEFNLNGCCPMRMLTGQANDRGALVKNLARAVSRSRVIICCGPLFGGDGLIGLIAASIGRRTERVNCEEYGIVTANDISVIEGSLPLVTPEGYFGGCIIESGPQTIIMLSENRNMRKSLMTNLIHPYLEEISILPDLAQRMKANSEKTAQDDDSKVTSASNPVPPAVDADAERAAAEAAAIVAAALGEAAVAGSAAVKESADIPSASDSEGQEEITPADVELEIEETEEKEEETPDETAEGAPASEKNDEEISQLGEEIGEEKVEYIEPAESENETQNSEIIGMVPPEDDNLFSAEGQPETEETPVEESFFDDDDLFVAEVEPVDDEIPDAEQFMEVEQPEVELYIEPGAVTRKKMDEYAREYVPSKSDEMFLSGDDDDYEYDYDFEKRKKRFSFNSPIAILVVLLVIVLLILGYVLIVVPYSSGVDFDQYIQELFGVARISSFK